MGYLIDPNGNKDYGEYLQSEPQGKPTSDELAGAYSATDAEKLLCEFCGAYSPRSCELRDEMNGVCPWEDSDDDI